MWSLSKKKKITTTPSSCKRALRLFLFDLRENGINSWTYNIAQLVNSSITKSRQLNKMCDRLSLLAVQLSPSQGLKQRLSASSRLGAETRAASLTLQTFQIRCDDYRALAILCYVNARDWMRMICHPLQNVPVLNWWKALGLKGRDRGNMSRVQRWRGKKRPATTQVWGAFSAWGVKSR